MVTGSVWRAGDSYKVRITNIKPIAQGNGGIQAEVEVKITSPLGDITLNVPVGPTAQTMNEVAIAAIQSVHDFAAGVAQAAQDAAQGVKFGP